MRIALLLLISISLWAQSQPTGRVLALGSNDAPSSVTESPGPGTYSSTQNVTLVDATAQFILYTTSGSTPSCPATGTVYSGAIPISVTTTLKYLPCNGVTGGTVVTSVYTISLTTPITFITSVHTAPGTGNGGTSAAINCSTANFGVIEASYYTSGGTPTVTIGNLSNSAWFGPFTTYSSVGGNDAVARWYAPNATFSSSETFSFTGSGVYPGWNAACYSGVAPSSPLMQSVSAGSGSTVTTISPGSLTPPNNAALMLTTLVHDGTVSGPTVGSSFACRQCILEVSNKVGSGLADLIQTGAIALNPAWTWANATIAATTQDTFANASMLPTAYTIFHDFENSTNGTTLTAAILSAGSHAGGTLNNAAGNFSISGTGTATVSTPCQSPAQITGKNIAGNVYQDSSGTRGIALTTTTGTASISVFYAMPAATNFPNSMSVSRWTSFNVPSSDTNYYSSGGPSKGGGDFNSFTIHNGTAYIETQQNPNGADDGGSAYTYLYATSTTSNTIGIGANLTFTTSNSLGLTAGIYLRIEQLNTPANAMLVTVVSDSGTTLVVSPVTAYGSGTFTSWGIMPWYYVSQQFVGYQVATTSTTSNTIPGSTGGSLTWTTAGSLGLANGTIISVFNGTANGVGCSVTSNTGTSLTCTVTNFYGSGSGLTSWNISTSVQTLQIYDSLGNLISTQKKISQPASTGGPTRYGWGFGGDSSASGYTFCVDGAVAQWEGAIEWPIAP